MAVTVAAPIVIAPPPAEQTVNDKRCTALSTLVESKPPIRCTRLFDHSGECRFEGLWEE